ncbi:MAG: response regulator [Candidatus Lindowbacteria bacterium]|nr:response regulator [Candidatus Lindowbacteria bacterium]
MPSHRILLVDDEENILRALKRTLIDEDLDIETAPNGQEGLERLKNSSFTVVISDQRMPGMSGVEFLKEAKQVRPESVRIILSGYAEVGSILDAINEGEVFRFVHKPWNDDELKTLIRQSIAHYELVEENRKLQEQITKKNQELEAWARVLEERVAERTRELELSNKVLCLAQDILEDLPIAVVGIGRDGVIALVNAEANRLFSGSGSILGQEYVNALPAGITGLLKEVLDSGKPAEIPEYHAGSNRLRIRCQYVNGFASPGERVVLLAEGFAFANADSRGR